MDTLLLEKPKQSQFQKQEESYSRNNQNINKEIASNSPQTENNQPKLYQNLKDIPEAQSEVISIEECQKLDNQQINSSILKKKNQDIHLVEEENKIFFSRAVKEVPILEINELQIISYPNFESYLEPQSYKKFPVEEIINSSIKSEKFGEIRNIEDFNKSDQPFVHTMPKTIITNQHKNNFFEKQPVNSDEDIEQNQNSSQICFEKHFSLQTTLNNLDIDEIATQNFKLKVISIKNLREKYIKYVVNFKDNLQITTKEGNQERSRLTLFKRIQDFETLCLELCKECPLTVVPSLTLSTIEREKVIFSMLRFLKQCLINNQTRRSKSFSKFLLNKHIDQQESTDLRQIYIEDNFFTWIKATFLNLFSSLTRKENIQPHRLIHHQNNIKNLLSEIKTRKSDIQLILHAKSTIQPINREIIENIMIKVPQIDFDIIAQDRHDPQIVISLLESLCLDLEDANQCIARYAKLCNLVEKEEKSISTNPIKKENPIIQMRSYIEKEYPKLEAEITDVEKETNEKLRKILEAVKMI